MCKDRLNYVYVPLMIPRPSHGKGAGNQPRSGASTVIRHMRAQFKGGRIAPSNSVHRRLRSDVVTSATPIPDTLTSAFGGIKARVFPMFNQSPPRYSSGNFPFDYILWSVMKCMLVLCT